MQKEKLPQLVLDLRQNTLSEKNHLTDPVYVWLASQIFENELHLVEFNFLDKASEYGKLWADPRSLIEAMEKVFWQDVEKQEERINRLFDSFFCSGLMFTSEEICFKLIGIYFQIPNEKIQVEVGIRMDNLMRQDNAVASEVLNFILGSGKLGAKKWAFDFLKRLPTEWDYTSLLSSLNPEDEFDRKILDYIAEETGEGCFLDWLIAYLRKNQCEIENCFPLGLWARSLLVKYVGRMEKNNWSLQDEGCLFELNQLDLDKTFTFGILKILIDKELISEMRSISFIALMHQLAESIGTGCDQKLLPSLWKKILNESNCLQIMECTNALLSDKIENKDQSNYDEILDLLQVIIFNYGKKFDSCQVMVTMKYLSRTKCPEARALIHQMVLSCEHTSEMFGLLIMKYPAELRYISWHHVSLSVLVLNFLLMEKSKSPGVYAKRFEAFLVRGIKDIPFGAWLEKDKAVLVRMLSDLKVSPDVISADWVRAIEKFEAEKAEEESLLAQLA